jgi:O-antigen ligase
MIALYYILLLLMPFWNYPKLPKFGETWTLIKIAGVVTVLAAALQALMDGSRPRLLHWRESRLFLLLFGWAAVSAWTISRWEWAAFPLMSYLSLAAYLFPTLIFLQDVTALRSACQWVAWSMLLASYSVFSQFVKYGVSRPGGIVGDPNYYALVAVCMLPLCLALWPDSTGVRRVLIGLTCGLLIASTLLGASRGGFLSLLFCLGYLIFHGRRRVLLLAGLVVLMAGMTWLLPHTPLDRFVQGDRGTAVSTEIRRELLKAGWEMIKAQPLTGVGLGMFKPRTAELQTAVADGRIGHNTYVEVAAELGLPACLLFLAILWSGWRRSRKLAEWFSDRGQIVASRIARAVEAGIIAYAVGALFLSAEYVRQLWLLVWFGLALAQIAEAGEEEGEAPGPERIEHELALPEHAVASE